MIGRVVQRTDPDSGTDTMTYNAFGGVRTSTNGAGEQREFTYDLLGRVLQIDDDTVGKSTFEYDGAPGFGLGQIAAATNDNAATLFEYDNMGRPVRVEQTTGTSTLYAETSYDENTGRRTEMRVPSLDGSELSTHYSYSSYGELETAYFSGGFYWKAYERDDPMRRVTAELRGSMYVERDFDEDTHHLTRYSAESWPESIVERESYSYAPDGRLEGFAELGGSVQAFDYDDRGRLVGWQRGPTSTTYTYDALGNQTQGASGERTFGTDGAGPHAVTRDGTGEKFAYDAAGRREDGSFGWSAQYTSFGLPTLVNDPTGGSRTYAYDAFNQRVTEFQPGGVRVDTLGQLLELTTPPSGKGSMTYGIYIEGERVAEMTEDYEGWTRRYLNNDQVGSSLPWADAAGQRHDEAITEPFGAVMSGSTNEQRLGSHAFDEPMGLVNARGRIYDPTTATFLTTDPIRVPTATHMNLYGYAASDPVNLYDPFGFQPAVGEGGGDGAGEFDNLPPLQAGPAAIPADLSEWDGLRAGTSTFQSGGVVIPAIAVRYWQTHHVDLARKLRVEILLTIGVDLDVIHLESGAVLLRARQHLGRPWGQPSQVGSATREAQRMVLNFFGGDGVTRTLNIGSSSEQRDRVFLNGNMAIQSNDAIPDINHIVLRDSPLRYVFDNPEGTLLHDDPSLVRDLNLTFSLGFQLIHELFHGHDVDVIEGNIINRVNAVRGELGLPLRESHDSLWFYRGQTRIEGQIR